jgi:TRAP-type C4-dicarboxylate transport system substrate-binding protein
MAFWKTLNDKEKDVFRRAVRVASIKGQMEVERRLAGVKAELKSKNIKTIQTDVSGFKKAVQDNINTILANDKDAIAVYKKIMAKDY